MDDEEKFAAAVTAIVSHCLKNGELQVTKEDIEETKQFDVNLNIKSIDNGGGYAFYLQAH